MSTFANVKLEVYDRLQLDSTPPSNTVTRIERHLNRWHRRLTSGPLFSALRRVELTQASVADQHAYGISLEEIRFITERTNDRRLHKRSEDWWRSHYPDPTANTGTPRYWVPLGNTRVAVQPSDASELFVVSTAAGDTTQTAYVEAIRSNGQKVTLSVTLTGTTAVSLDTATTDVVAVTDFYLSAVGAGTVTLHEDSGSGTTLATLSIGRTKARYFRYVLAPTPSSAITYYLAGTATQEDLSNATDEFFVPEDFDDILINAATYEEWLTHGRLKDAQWIRDEVRQRILELRNWVWMNYFQDDPNADPPDQITFDESISLPIS